MTTHPMPVAAPPRPADGEKRPRTWVVTIAITWGVVLAVGIGWALATGGPTAREQTTVAEALPVLDRAIAQLATAATADGQAVAAISGLSDLGGCKITLIRSGERYQRALTVVVTPGTEAALISRVGARLPADYHASVATGSIPRLVADAGLWVRLTGSVAGKGQVRFVADTGSCRPLGDVASAIRAQNSPPAATEANRAEAATALARLGVAAAGWNTYQAPCPGGGTIATVEATGADNAEPGALDEVLRGLGTPVVSAPEAYAYTAGTQHVAVRPDVRHVIITATTACP